ncbi:hypothetical protein [Acidicapsa ligni]|uniref:hypothetical protein n=1 Tax=Acidicapsa ligni TaxID=542300 RepID=UPI0021E0F145|nr:hypothetical protein [Acidicapsa ligni]
MKILIVTGMEGAENCVIALTSMLGRECEAADSRKAALAALKRREYVALVIDERLADADPEGAELLWEQAGLAIPLQLSFASHGAQRLAREIRMALARREREQALARQAATEAIERELKSTVAGLLLHSELALQDRAIPAPLADKLRLMADLAWNLRQQLSPVEAALSRI